MGSGGRTAKDSAGKLSASGKNNKASVPWLKTIANRQNKVDVKHQLMDIANQAQVSVDYAEKLVNEALNKWLSEGAYAMRRSLHALELTLDDPDQRFKAQVELYNETGHAYSGGAVDPYGRADLENKDFGTPKDGIPDGDRPVYGMLMPDDESDPGRFVSYIKNGPGSHYGHGEGTVVVFNRDAVRKNTTLTLGDSLDNEDYIWASSAAKPKFAGMAMDRDDMAYAISHNQSTSDAISSVGRYEYMELQFHGTKTHSVNNIACVYIAHNVAHSENGKRVIKKLKEHGIKFKVYK